MVLRIKQLSAVIANQIAAGEVIERPASIVKELLENALDAESNEVTLDIGFGGLNQIKISDNGMGIFAEDLPLAIAAHATSKISKLSDLSAIYTMGFRGEALASIASVSRLTIRSKTESEEHGTMLTTTNQEISLAPCARMRGTTVDVRDIFYNAPVRKKFLKSERSEFQAIEMVVKRFAMSAPKVMIQLNHNNKNVLTLAAANDEQTEIARLTKLFGKEFIDKAIYIQVDHTGLQLRGWLGHPSYQRNQNDKQWVYINGRMVKDKLINHAIKQAYESLLYPGKYPSCLLHLSIGLEEVDVNVHPTKHEVRFQQPRLVHDLIVSQLQKALSARKNSFLLDSDCINAESESMLLEGEDTNRLDLSMLFANSNHSAQRSIMPLIETMIKPDNVQWQLQEFKPSGFVKSQQQPEVPQMIAIDEQFAIFVVDKQAYLLDWMALQTLWLQEQIAKQALPLLSRPLLVPIYFALTEPELNRWSTDLCQLLEDIGIKVEWSEEQKIIVRTLPVIAPQLDIKKFLSTVFSYSSLDLDSLLSLLVNSQKFTTSCNHNSNWTAFRDYLYNNLPLFHSSSHCLSLSSQRCRELLHD